VLQRTTATYLQHSATHCNTLPRTPPANGGVRGSVLQCFASVLPWCVATRTHLCVAGGLRGSVLQCCRWSSWQCVAVLQVEFVDMGSSTHTSHIAIQCNTPLTHNAHTLCVYRFYLAQVEFVDLGSGAGRLVLAAGVCVCEIERECVCVNARE